MLAYRHAFHAGNHADVLKHLVLVTVLRHLNQKEKGWRLLDTHAGAGGYALSSPYAETHREHAEGIGRLWNVPAAELPALQWEGEDEEAALAAQMADYQEDLEDIVIDPDTAAALGLDAGIAGIRSHQASRWPKRRALVRR